MKEPLELELTSWNKKKILRLDNRVTGIIKFTLKKNKMSFCRKV